MFRGFYARKIDIIKMGFESDESLIAVAAKQKIALEELLQKYREHNLLIETKNRKYIIHVGVFELIKFLDATPHIDISFFSAMQDEEENNERIKILMCLALGEQRYNVIKDDTKIGSYKDIITIPRELALSQMYIFGLDFGIEKKNLRTFLKLNNTNLKWSILIENDEKSVCSFEEKNILRIPAIFDFHYELEDSDATFFRINHIFYLAGVLDTVLERTKKEKTTPSDILFKLQYTKELTIENGKTQKKYQFKTGRVNFFFGQRSTDALL